MLAQTSRPSLFLPMTSLQLQHYHGITQSFSQRQPSIPRILNSFRTLSIATGVVPSRIKTPSVLRSQCPLCCASSACICPSAPSHAPRAASIPCGLTRLRILPVTTGVLLASLCVDSSARPFSPFVSFRIQSFRSASVVSRGTHHPAAPRVPRVLMRGVT